MVGGFLAPAPVAKLCPPLARRPDAPTGTQVGPSRCPEVKKTLPRR